MPLKEREGWLPLHHAMGIVDPIFIIGTERSGTNLLRLILNTHPDIAVPHPPHIMKNFSGLEPLYGDLSIDSNFKRLIHDVVRSVELHPYPWGMEIDRDEVFRTARARDLINVYFSVYDQYLKATGKKRWCCKSTFMIDHVARIIKHHPGARFIYMVRDGRDVAASARKSIFNHYSAYYIARLWKKEQDQGIYWLKRLPGEAILLLRYEDLVERPEDKVREVCGFLDEPFDARMLKFFETDEARKSGSLSVSWENTKRPIMRENVDKFRTELKENAIRVFEAIAGPELEYFGYKPSGTNLSDTDRERLSRFRTTYLIEEKLLGLKAHIIHMLKDRNNTLRFKKSVFLKYAGLRLILRSIF
jgi:hypothetical protein